MNHIRNFAIVKSANAPQSGSSLDNDLISYEELVSQSMMVSVSGMSVPWDKNIHISRNIKITSVSVCIAENQFIISRPFMIIIKFTICSIYKLMFE